jgi:hypothetical protein
VTKDLSQRHVQCRAVHLREAGRAPLVLSLADVPAGVVEPLKGELRFASEFHSSPLSRFDACATVRRLDLAGDPIVCYMAQPVGVPGRSPL